MLGNKVTKYEVRNNEEGKAFIEKIREKYEVGGAKCYISYPYKGIIAISYTTIIDTEEV